MLTTNANCKVLSGYPKVCISDANKLRKGFGKGVFAQKNLKKGEVAFIARGKLVALTVKSEDDSSTYPNAIGISPRRWLNPFSSNPLCFLNHSCDPNMGIRGKRTFVALRDIEKGEHLTIDYSITECDKLWSLGEQCVCGSPRCRKKIRSIQFLPISTFRKYSPYIPTIFKRIYLREKKI